MAHKRRQRQQSAGVLTYTNPQYEWALDVEGRAVHVSQAGRGDSYFCPLCGDKMVARLGDQKRHHFAHSQTTDCPPEDVARAAAGRWLVYHLRQSLADCRNLTIKWRCPLCTETHAINVLGGIAQVQPLVEQDGVHADVALLDAAGKLRAAIAVTMPSQDDLSACMRRGIMVIVVSLDGVRSRMLDLPTLLSGSAILGGPCTTRQAAARAGIVSDILTLRTRLTALASQPPYRTYGPLETVDGLTHVFSAGGQRLWLPPILWQRAVGGMLHSVIPALQIISQEWKQPDGSVIALYYVTFKDTCAVAVRRFPPGQGAYARLDSSLFRTSRLSAVDVARSFAEC
ncbi:MAG: hypothetical protein JW966_00030 [Anaerolineae bacterium]|nr:hypothetical protein [Anaerolineae bacterium]